MNTKFFYLPLILCFLMMAFAVSCTDDAIVENADTDVVPQEITITATLATDEVDSRLTFSDNGLSANSSAITMKWDADDSFAFTCNYTDAANATTFTLKSGAGTSTAVFEGTDPDPSTWSFNCYYPSTIRCGCDWNNFSYDGQKQTGNNNLDHIKDYFAIWLFQWRSQFDGNISFVNSHHAENNLRQSSCFKFILKNFPLEIEPFKVSLSMVDADGHEVETTYDGIESNYGFHCTNAATRYDKTVSLDLESIGKTKDLTAYLMLSPISAKLPANSYLRVSVIGTNAEGELVKIYRDKPVGTEERELKGGYLHSITVTDEWVEPYFSANTTVSGSETKNLQTHTQGNGIKVVLMGDGFSDRQIADGTYENVMKKGMEAFFSEQPFTYYRDYFDVDMVYAVSKQEGCYDEATETLPNNTAFSTYFGSGTYVAGNWEKCAEYAQKVAGIDNTNIKNTLIIVMMNSAKYAGTCHMRYYYSTTTDYGEGTSVAYFPIGTSDEDLQQVLVHEANGHGFGKLDDEYYYNSYYEPGDYLNQLYDNHKKLQKIGWNRNVSTTSEATEVYWADFIGDDTYSSEEIGVYEGASTYSKYWWRSTENSIMRHNTGGFNAPSRKIIYYRINKLAYGDSWEYDHDAFKALDVNWIPSATVSLNTRSAYDSEGGFIPLARPVITAVDEFGNAVERH